MVRTKKLETKVEEIHEAVETAMSNIEELPDPLKSLRLTTPKYYVELGSKLLEAGFVCNSNIHEPISLDNQPQSLDKIIAKMVELALFELLKLIVEDLSKGNKSRVGTMIHNGLKLAGG